MVGHFYVYFCVAVKLTATISSAFYKWMEPCVSEFLATSISRTVGVPQVGLSNNREQPDRHNSDLLIV